MQALVGAVLNLRDLLSERLFTQANLEGPATAELDEDFHCFPRA
jgi:hypothetical protein